ncbi:MAG TPA: ATP-binding protein [Ramlibacter sp.]|nr:ATP-binding protein [Ramlibacter sp.]
MSEDGELAFLPRASEVGRLIRAKDWSTSPLGPPANWPQSLRSIVNLVLSSAFPMFVAWGPSLLALYNDGYAQIMGDKHPGGLGQPFLEIWHEIRADLDPLAVRVMSGESFYMENLPLRMRRHGFDEDTWFTFSWSPVLDEQAGIAGVYCACTETTRMVVAEQRLRAREEWLQNLFHVAPGFAAVVRGREHVYDMANQAYMDLTGRRDLVGKSVAQALPEVIEQGFGATLDEVFRTGVPFVGRSVPVRLNHGGADKPYDAFVDFMFQPLRNPAGEVEAIFIQGHDVTEQHRAQQALRKADQQKDEFLATLAHELRNPLAPVRTAAYLLSSPDVGDAARLHATKVIDRQVGHMSRLLDDLLDVSRITQRRLLLRKQAVQVMAVVDAAIEAAKPLADAKGHTIHVNVPNPLAQVTMDPLRMTQVLSNLLNNAAKYTDPGGRIELDVQSDAERVRFVVTDTGIGLSAQAVRNLFVMFAQEKSALDRSEGGLGIGLALVKGLVELHGGRVWATSKGAGQGSRFVVEIPMNAAAHRPADAQALAEDAGPAVCPQARSLCVLLADDNRDASDVLAEVLRMDGHRVYTAYDGHQALKLAAELRPQVMVLDIGMPGLNGYEVARQVRAQDWGATAYLVAATGWGQADDLKKAISAGFDRHITKPFDPVQLTELLASLSV